MNGINIALQIAMHENYLKEPGLNDSRKDHHESQLKFWKNQLEKYRAE